MGELRTKSIEKIEGRMANIEENSIRYQILESAKKFKSSWISLGQSLYTVWKDKLYREWGYLTFDAYTVKEIGVRKQTAVKLLKSYYFLEKEEPAYLESDHSKPEEAQAIPSYESVNLLRLAKNRKELGKSDYVGLRRDVLERGKDIKDVKKDLTAILKEKKEADPEEARETKRFTQIKRLLATLKMLRREIEISKVLPSNIIQATSSLISKIEEEMAS